MAKSAFYEILAPKVQECLGLLVQLVPLIPSLQVNLRAAPYDFRYGANSPTGQLYMEMLQKLVEETYNNNGKRKVNILAHRCVSSG